MTTNKRELQLHCCFQTIPFHVVNIVNPPPYLQKNLKLVKNFIVNDKITASLKTNMCSKLSLFQTLQTPPSYHQCNQRQLGIKTATDQRHKVGDKCPCSALSLPSHLSALDRKLKTCAQKGKKILKGRMTLLNFLSRLQI